MVRKASAKTASPTVTTIPISKARNNLGALIQQGHLNREYLILEKDGIPMAGIIDIDEFEDYSELQDPTVRPIIARGRQEYLAGKSQPAEDLLRQLQD
jgi:PHD/YefM family antitoxin component YafN of YafNO toxin-antitoxin module